MIRKENSAAWGGVSETPLRQSCLKRHALLHGGDTKHPNADYGTPLQQLIPPPPNHPKANQKGLIWYAGGN